MLRLSACDETEAGKDRVLKTRKGTRADAFSCEQPGQTRRPPGPIETGRYEALARFSRLDIGQGPMQDHGIFWICECKNKSAALDMRPS